MKKAFRLIGVALIVLSLSGSAPARAEGPSDLRRKPWTGQGVRQVAGAGIPDFYANVRVLGGPRIIGQGATEYCALYAAAGAINLSRAKGLPGQGGASRTNGANAIRPYMDADEMAREYRARWPGDEWANVPNVATLLAERGVGIEGANYLLRDGRWCECEYSAFVAQSRAWVLAKLAPDRGQGLAAGQAVNVYPWVASKPLTEVKGKGKYHAIVVTAIRGGWVIFVDPMDGKPKMIREDVFWKTVLGPNEWDGGWLVAFVRW